jgi:type IV pilus assembly protein PilE
MARKPDTKLDMVHIRKQQYVTLDFGGGTLARCCNNRRHWQLDRFKVPEIIGQTTMQMKRNSGFTLVELLVTLAILGILAGIAYPSYQNSMRKTRRTDGISAALAIQVAQEKFRGNCPFYAQNIGNSNTCGATAALSTVLGDTSSNEGYYTLSIASGTATGNAYTINIDPTGVQAADTDCDPMTLTFNAANPTGLKGPAGCW